MHGFTNEKLLKKHRKRSCKTDNAQRIKMPTDPTLRFTNVHKLLKAPFVAYADFECTLKDVREHEGEEVDTKKYHQCSSRCRSEDQDLSKACTL